MEQDLFYAFYRKDDRVMALLGGEELPIISSISFDFDNFAAMVMHVP